MATRITITLEDAEAKALAVLAQRERRHPREQAAMMIRRELEQRGLLAELSGQYSPENSARDVVVVGHMPIEDEADVLARVYALILSWPTAEEKAGGESARAIDDV